MLLALNAGSSSLKFALFSEETPPTRIVAGAVDRIGSPTAILDAFEALLERLAETAPPGDFSAIGHRVVHGLSQYVEPQIVTGQMIDDLEQIVPFAPDHLPAQIALMTAVSERFPGVPQVACFDTAFHRDLPRVARLLPIPRRLEAAGVRRYGFHGLSYEFLMEELVRLDDPAATNGRVILAHLGNGSSLAAVRDGKCTDTSMGFTPAAGLMMGTRSGDLDPGLVSFLARSEEMTAGQFDRMINDESGLLGVSGSSSDMRTLLERESEEVGAAEAIALYCYQAKKWIGSFAAALGGVDTLVFSGGIGEHAALVRARICDGLAFLGIELNEAQNAGHEPIISAKTGNVRVRVIQTDEELMIARLVRRVLEPGPDPKGTRQ